MDAIFTMVDIVLLTIKDHRLHVALVKRDREPKFGVDALPGGKIEDYDDDAYATAMRVLKTKASIESPYLQQLKTYTGKKRDTRRWSISIAHYALVPYSVVERANHPGVMIVPVDELGELPFDHNDMVNEAVARVRSTSQYSSLPCHLVGERFTMAQLHAVYEAAMGQDLVLPNFRRKIGEMDCIEPIPDEFDTSKPSRPAQLYRLKPEFREKLRILERGL